MKNEIVLWLFFITAGFMSGSVLYAYLLPKLIKKQDVRMANSDHNPGTFNAYLSCGAVIGTLCLVMEVAKGFLPVFVCSRIMGTDRLAFAVLMLSPVAGHAFSPFLHFKGGKGIAVSFGALFGLIPNSFSVFLLAAIYIIFALVFRIRPNRKLSLFTYITFAILCSALLVYNGKIPIAIGCLLISSVVIFKHFRSVDIPEKQPEEDKEKIEIYN